MSLAGCNVLHHVISVWQKGQSLFPAVSVLVSGYSRGKGSAGLLKKLGRRRRPVDMSF